MPVIEAAQVLPLHSTSVLTMPETCAMTCLVPIDHPRAQYNRVPTVGIHWSPRQERCVMTCIFLANADPPARNSMHRSLTGANTTTLPFQKTGKAKRHTHTPMVTMIILTPMLDRCAERFNNRDLVVAKMYVQFFASSSSLVVHGSISIVYFFVLSSH